MTVNRHSERIQDYYSPDDLYDKIVDGLNRLGKDLAVITPEDLQSVDEFHIRGEAATRELIALAAFMPGGQLLDIGCGIGGSTRRLARDTGCRVTGIDLSDAYIDTAQRLTRLLKMQDRLGFQAASALDLPFADNLFGGAWSLHMNMNVADKPAWLEETFRVLKPGGRLVLYEVCGGENAPPYYPVPWAQEGGMSFLVGPETFRALITAAGFKVAVWNDRTNAARRSFANAREPAGNPSLPPLGIHLLIGEDLPVKINNLRRNLDEARVTVIEAVAVKP